MAQYSNYICTDAQVNDGSCICTGDVTIEITDLYELVSTPPTAPPVHTFLSHVFSCWTASLSDPLASCPATRPTPLQWGRPTQIKVRFLDLGTVRGNLRIVGARTSQSVCVSET